MEGTPAGRRIPCVGGVVVDDLGRILLVRRGTPPGVGLWSVPGGRRWEGESDVDGVRREVWEETAVSVRVTGHAGTIERPAPGGDVYVIADFFCTPVGESENPRAGDDAADARWWEPAQVRSLDCVPGLVACLEEWGVL